MSQRKIEKQVSVVVNKNLSVTFGFRSENAEKVEIGGDFRFRRKAVGREAIGTEPTGSVTAVPMKKSAEDSWTLTSESMLPMIYRYFFVVDGIVTPTRRVKVDGPDAMPWDLIPSIPHGTLVIEKFRSEVLKMVKNCIIYLPPNYWSTKKKYPILYLLHGGGGDHREWVYEGYTDNIMDYLISTRQAKEMIVAMPDRALLTSEERRQLDSLSGKDLEAFMDTRDKRRMGYFVNEVIPFIESRYPVLKESISIAGLSGGGGDAFHLVTSYPDMFVAAGIFSGSVGMARSADYEPYRTMMRNTLETTKEKLGRLKLLYVSCGNYDPQLEPIRTMHRTLEELKIRHTYVEGEGGHRWPFWSRSLVDFASRLSQAL